MMRRLLPMTALLASGCLTDPSTAVLQPMTARPQVAKAAPPANGAIYNVATSRPLFEDVRARFVGDTLTINLVENSSGTKSSTESNEDTGSLAYEVSNPTLFGMVSGGKGGIANKLNSSHSAKSDTKGANANSNNISGTITVTVVEVLSNGNLVVSGEKRITINSGTEFIRLSGVVNPVYITAANTVSSTQLADARIESKEKTGKDFSQVISMLAKFFFALL